MHTQIAASVFALTRREPPDFALPRVGIYTYRPHSWGELNRPIAGVVVSKVSRYVALGIVAAVAMVGGAWASRALLQPAPPQLTRGTLIEPAQPLPFFTLVDQDGSRFDRSRLEGRWSLLFFGFTNCPGPCPAALSMLAMANKSLADLPPAERPRVVFISLDPQRDTPAVLKSYVAQFNPGFIGVTGNESDLRALTNALHVPYAIVPTPDGSYMVDHSLAVFAIDPKGGLHALFNAPQEPAAISRDYRELVTRLRLL